MIKYALRCDREHIWDAWFPSISGYDDQRARGLVDCPYCGSKQIEKAPMAPSIVTSKSQVARQETESEPAPQPTLPVANELPNLTIPEPIRAMLAEIKERVEKTHDFVGDTFAREVRAMHEGETEERPIYGQATPSEVRALIEDDIPIAPLSMLAAPKGVKGVH